MIFKNMFLGVIIFSVFLSCKDSSEKIKEVTLNEKSNKKIEYFENGEVKTIVDIDKGIEHGIYNKYYDNQIIAETGVKIKGKKNGVWRHYNSHGQLETAKYYYNDSLVYNLDINDFVLYKKDINKDLQIGIPKKWKIVDEINENPILLVIRKECEKGISFCPNLTITYEKPIADISEIVGYLDESDKQLSLSFENYRVLKERKYEVNGRVYFEKIYTGDVSSLNKNIGAITTWIFDKKNTYIITGLALNEKEHSFLKSEGFFKEITNSINIKN